MTYVLYSFFGNPTNDFVNSLGSIILPVHLGNRFYFILVLCFRAIADTKKEQNQQSRDMIKKLTKETRDKADLDKLKREKQKSHIENVVRCIQNVSISCLLIF